MIEDTLQKIARQIMALNEETLTALLPRYKERMMNFAPTQQWEESVVIYFLINGLRIKNSQFNDKIKEYTGSGENGEKINPHIRPRLRLVKTAEKDGFEAPGDCGSGGCSDNQYSTCNSGQNTADDLEKNDLAVKASEPCAGDPAVEAARNEDE